MSYLDITQSFIEDSRSTKNLKDLTVLFHNFVTKLGCTHFVCMSHVDVFNPPEDAVILSSYPLEWGKYHSEQEYHKNDPVQMTCRRQVNPFIWSSEHWRYMLDKTQLNILDEASEFGLRDGWTCPVNAPTGYDASLSVVFEKGGIDPNALNALQLVATYFYTYAMQMKNNQPGAAKPVRKFTQRRHEILELMAQGKSNGVIGDILNISENTVKHHAAIIYKDLGVGHRTQAVVEGLFAGTIRFQDVRAMRPINSNENSGFVLLQP